MVDTSARLAGLRQLMQQHKLDAYYVPTADAHQSEYVAGCDKRRAWVSGFSGSSGRALVTAKAALLWTDGRYFAQATQQLHADQWTLMKEGLPATPKVQDWMLHNLAKGANVGVDATLMSVSEWRRWKTALGENVHVVPVEQNLVDLVWKDRPAVPSAPIFPLTQAHTGQTVQEKVARILKQLDKQATAERPVYGVVLSALDEIAWTFNLRGADIPYNPVFLSYAIITRDSVRLYVDSAKVTAAVRDHLGAAVQILPYGQVFADLKQLPVGKGAVVLPDNSASLAVRSSLAPQLPLEAPSPVLMLKAIKNPVELAGFRNAHVRDAAALCNFFCWLEEALKKKEPVTEMTVCEKAEAFRREQKDFMGLSFATIAGSGPNGAIIHYEPGHGEGCAPPRAVTTSEMLLLDSGGQYLDGTTDVTRTVHLGEPSAFERRCFTRVLQGHIALASAVFPPDMVGPFLDVLARRPLWAEGLDYYHGTGHGIGHFLNVHEGPFGVTCRVREGSTLFNYPLEPGMVLSNEPGYYHEGGFGVRVENVVVVTPADTPFHFDNRTHLCFETITLVPLQTKLMDVSLMSGAEIAWVNRYHAECRQKVAPLLSGAALDWLVRNTQPLPVAAHA